MAPSSGNGEGQWEYAMRPTRTGVFCLGSMGFRAKSEKIWKGGRVLAKDIPGSNS